MIDDPVYRAVLIAAFAYAGLIVLAAPFQISPCGRFATTKLGPLVPPRLAWWLMELPATVVFHVFYWTGPAAWEPAPLVLAAIWTIHYANRGWIFPFRIRARPGSGMSVTVVSMGMIVTAMHGYLNGALLSGGASHFGTSWLVEPRFVAGVLVYYAGFALTVHTEGILRRLRDGRAPGDDAYRIPQGGGFRWVTSPHYLGELVAWAGWALLTWSLAGVFIFVVSAANLIPRARANQRWYRETFPDYPRERRVLVPFLW